MRTFDINELGPRISWGGTCSVHKLDDYRIVKVLIPQDCQSRRDGFSQDDAIVETLKDEVRGMFVFNNPCPILEVIYVVMNNGNRLTVGLIKPYIEHKESENLYSYPEVSEPVNYDCIAQQYCADQTGQYWRVDTALPESYIQYHNSYKGYKLDSKDLERKVVRSLKSLMQKDA